MHIVSFELNTEIEYAEDRHHGDKKSSLFQGEPPSWPNGAMDDNTVCDRYEEPWMRYEYFILAEPITLANISFYT